METNLNYGNFFQVFIIKIRLYCQNMFFWSSKTRIFGKENSVFSVLGLENLIFKEKKSYQKWLLKEQKKVVEFVKKTFLSEPMSKRPEKQDRENSVLADLIK